MAMTTAQYQAWMNLLRGALSSNVATAANPSTGELLGFFNQLLSESIGAATLSAARQASLDNRLRGVITGASPLLNNPSVADVALFIAQLATDAASGVTLSAVRYAAILTVFLDQMAPNKPGESNPSVGELRSYLSPYATTTIDFKMLGSFAFVLQSDKGVTQSGGFLDSWTDQQGGLVGTQTTTKRPAVIVGPNGAGGPPGIQFAAGNNCSLPFALNMPVPGTTPSHIYAVVRQDAWSLNGALFGSPLAEFSIRCLQFDATPKISQAQINITNPAGPAIGVYGRAHMGFTFFGGDFCRYGTPAATTGANAGNIQNTGLVIANHFADSLPASVTYLLFIVKFAAFTGSELSVLDTAVASWAGASVQL